MKYRKKVKKSQNFLWFNVITRGSYKKIEKVWSKLQYQMNKTPTFPI